MSPTSTAIIAAIIAIAIVVLAFKMISDHTKLVEEKRILDANDPGKILSGVIGGFFQGLGL
jgi:hypothetical protein